MENNSVKSEFEIGKSCVKEFNIDIINRNFPNEKKYDFELKVGISDIQVKEEYQYVNIFLACNIMLKNEEREVLKIYIKYMGEFRASVKLEKNKFLNYCKYNGAPIISQNLRAYLKAVTALSEIEPIDFPTINFNNVFKEENKEK